MTRVFLRVFAHLLDCFNTWKAFWLFRGTKTIKECFFMSNREQTRKLVVLALLAGVSVVLVYFIRIPLIPLVPFLEYDPADIPHFSSVPWPMVL